MKIVADEPMSDITKKSGDEALAMDAREAAECLSTSSLLNFAQEQVDALPSSPEEITRKDSSSTTELSKRGCADWQRPHW
jgi:hypothetical protein